MEYPKELERAADRFYGYLKRDQDGFFIRIDTDDNTADENYDALLDMDFDKMLVKYEVSKKWADHNTQIIEFKKRVQVCRKIKQ